MCFPDFIGLRPLGLPFAARRPLRAWLDRKKSSSLRSGIFSRQALPQKAGNPRPLPLKSGKTASFFTGKKMQTFRPAFF